MNQNAEGKRDNKEKGRIMQWSGRKKRAVAAVTIAALAVLVVPVLAWLFFQKSLQTVTKINEPNPLKIGAGNARDIKELELSSIDVSGEKKYEDVVFCVYSTTKGLSYHLQLAHTTNIGFKYTIYPAVKEPADESGYNASVSYLDKKYYYKTTSTVPGGYLNKQGESEGGFHALAQPTGTYHDKTYATSNGNYKNVQANAEPLYWKTTSSLSLPNDYDDTGFSINYFVLHISWDASIQNNKETDMVYLMAEQTMDTAESITPTTAP